MLIAYEPLKLVIFIPIVCALLFGGIALLRRINRQKYGDIHAEIEKLKREADQPDGKTKRRRRVITVIAVVMIILSLLLTAVVVYERLVVVPSV